MEPPLKSYASCLEGRLLNMPGEVLDRIFQFLDQGDLHKMIRVHRAVTGAAAVQLYREPRFKSSYRLAQFATTVATSEQVASFVRCLLVWPEVAKVKDDLAGWREYKYRKETLYASVPSEDPKNPHPTKARFLANLGGDIPWGTFLHMLAACRNVREVYIGVNRPAEDWKILSKNRKVFAFTKKRFISDVPRSAMPRNPKEPAVGKADLVEQLCGLEHLQRVWMNNDITLDDVQAIIASCPNFVYGAFQVDRKPYHGMKDVLIANLEKDPSEWPKL